MGVKEAHGDINNLPSLKTRMKMSNRDTLNEKGFRIIIHSTMLAGRLRLGNPVDGTTIKAVIRCCSKH